jgi:hypothetical protein
MVTLGSRATLLIIVLSQNLTANLSPTLLISLLVNAVYLEVNLRFYFKDTE